MISSCAEIFISASFGNSHSISQFQIHNVPIHGSSKDDGKNFPEEQQAGDLIYRFFPLICCSQQQKIKAPWLLSPFSHHVKKKYCSIVMRLNKFISWIRDSSVWEIQQNLPWGNTTTFMFSFVKRWKVYSNLREKKKNWE